MIVELESGVWLADGEGDPARTTPMEAKARSHSTGNRRTIREFILKAMVVLLVVWLLLALRLCF